MSDANQINVPIQVGKEIFTILSEALYNNPYHLFREYVQNSIDSINSSDIDNGLIEIIVLNEDGSKADKISINDVQHLLFVDNGKGYVGNILDLATKLADSSKEISKNIGYKGIGRLSGYSYCNEITFLSSSSYAKLDALTIDLESLKKSVTDFFNIIDFVNNKYDKYLKDYISDSGFVVLMKNINFDIKNILTNPNFTRELSVRLKCKYDLEDIKSFNKDIISFLTKCNENIKFTLKYNGNEIKRAYKLNHDKESDYILNVINKDDNQIICKVIYKIGKQVTFSYRKNNDMDYGVKVYQKGMLVSKDIDVVEKIISYFGLLDKTATEYNAATLTFYTEIHIEIEDILPNSSRTWISYHVPENYNQKYVNQFMDFLREYIKESDSLRYSYSNYARKSTDNKSILKGKLLKVMEFFVNDFEAESNKLEYMFIDPHEKEAKSDTMQSSLKNNLEYLLPTNSGYLAVLNNKINEIIDELSTLNVNKHKYAAAMLYRSFLEVSLKYYSKENSVYRLPDDKINLFDALSNYNDLLKKKNYLRLPKPKADVIYNSIKMVLENKESIRILNNNIHDLEYSINKIVLINIRDGLKPILDDIYNVNE